MTKCWGNTFQRFCWRLKRELSNNRKPILLLFGNGYESQLHIVALLKLQKTFRIIHVADDTLDRKTKRVLLKSRQRFLIFRPYRKDEKYKAFTCNDAICPEELNFGFSSKDYFIIAGFKASEPSLIKGFYNGLFDSMYCPFLRYSDEWIQTLYQDMKDNEKIGGFMFDNLDSDSHHNITII